MKKRILLISLIGFCLLTLISCGAKKKRVPVPGPDVVREGVPETKTSKGGLVIRPEERKMPIFRSDPTRGYIYNNTSDIYIKVWLKPSFAKGRVLGPPNYDLPPGAIVDQVFLPLGDHAVYALGRRQTQHYGWFPIGAVSGRVFVSPDARGTFGWRIVFSNRDFPGR
jgi:hypothetical protein